MSVCSGLCTSTRLEICARSSSGASGKMCYLGVTYDVPSRLGRFFFLRSLTYSSSDGTSLRVSTYTLFLPLHAVYEFLLFFFFCEIAFGESPTKKDCRRRGIRHVDKWDSSLSCWPSNISVSRRSVRQFRADVITLDKENIDDNLS